MDVVLADSSSFFIFRLMISCSINSFLLLYQNPLYQIPLYQFPFSGYISFRYIRIRYINFPFLLHQIPLYQFPGKMLHQIPLYQIPLYQLPHPRWKREWFPVSRTRNATAAAKEAKNADDKQNHAAAAAANERIGSVPNASKRRSERARSSARS